MVVLFGKHVSSICLHTKEPMCSLYADIARVLYKSTLTFPKIRLPYVVPHQKYVSANHSKFTSGLVFKLVFRTGRPTIVREANFNTCISDV